MKPRRRLLKTYYWTCLKGHQHPTKEFAERCIAKSGPSRTRWDDEKYARAKALRESGLTLEEVGRHFGIGKQRVRDVLATWERKLHWRAMAAERQAKR